MLKKLRYKSIYFVAMASLKIAEGISDYISQPLIKYCDHYHDEYLANGKSKISLKFIKLIYKFRRLLAKITCRMYRIVRLMLLESRKQMKLAYK